MIKNILRNQRKEFVIIGLSVTFLVLILLSVFFWARSVNGKEKEAELIKAEQQALVNPFEDVRLSAHSAIVKEISTGKILYEKNADEVLPFASLTKVLTSVTALDILAVDDLVRISPMALQYGNDSSFVPGSYFKLEDITKVALVASSNTAARSIAIAAGEKIAQPSEDALATFIGKMNVMASKIGMEKSEFKNPTGLDEKNETEAGAVGSARDMSRLFEYTLKTHQEVLESTREDYFSVRSREGYEHRVVNTNNIVGELPNIIGSKTGFTDIAGGNLAVVIDPGLNTPVVIVVLGSSKEGRFKDVERLSNATLDYFLLKQ